MCPLTAHLVCVILDYRVRRPDINVLVPVWSCPCVFFFFYCIHKGKHYTIDINKNIFRLNVLYSFGLYTVCIYIYTHITILITNQLYTNTYNTFTIQN